MRPPSPSLHPSPHATDFTCHCVPSDPLTEWFLTTFCNSCLSGLSDSSTFRLGAVLHPADHQVTPQWLHIIHRIKPKIPRGLKGPPVLSLPPLQPRLSQRPLGTALFNDLALLRVLSFTSPVTPVAFPLPGRHRHSLSLNLSLLSLSHFSYKLLNASVLISVMFSPPFFY